jgi:hypothetical protein
VWDRAGRANKLFPPFSTAIHVIIFQSRVIIAEIEKGIASLGIESNLFGRGTMELRLEERLKHAKTKPDPQG